MLILVVLSIILRQQYDYTKIKVSNVTFILLLLNNGLSKSSLLFTYEFLLH